MDCPKKVGWTRAPESRSRARRRPRAESADLSWVGRRPRRRTGPRDRRRVGPEGVSRGARVRARGARRSCGVPKPSRRWPAEVARPAARSRAPVHWLRLYRRGSPQVDEQASPFAHLLSGHSQACQRVIHAWAQVSLRVGASLKSRVCWHESHKCLCASVCATV